MADSDYWEPAQARPCPNRRAAQAKRQGFEKTGFRGSEDSGRLSFDSNIILTRASGRPAPGPSDRMSPAQPEARHPSPTGPAR